MKRSDVLKWAQSTDDGSTKFKSALKLFRFSLSDGLQIVLNHKRIIEEANTINEAIKLLEPKVLDELRKKAQEKGADIDQINKEYNDAYQQHWYSKEVQDFLKEESGIVLNRVKLDELFVRVHRHYLGTDITENVEALMLFTNVEEAFSNDAPVRPEKRVKTKNK